MKKVSLDPSEIVANHLQDRGALLQQIIHVLDEDERMLSAWLWGSQLRNESDEFSDLDLWIVVPDASIEYIERQAHNFLRRIRETLIAYEVADNAPMDGHYFLSIYPGLVAPHHVDWIWQEIGSASLPPNARYLVKKENIPVSEEPPIFPGGKPRNFQGDLDRIEHNIRFFWAMLPVAIKKTIRASNSLSSELDMLLLNPVTEASELLGVSPSKTSSFVPREDESASEALNRLRGLSGEVKLLMQSAEEMGAQVLSMHVADQIEDHFELAEASLQANATTNSSA